MTLQGIYYSFTSFLVIICILYLIYICYKITKDYIQINSIDNTRKERLKKLLLTRHKLD